MKTERSLPAPYQRMQHSKAVSLLAMGATSSCLFAPEFKHIPRTRAFPAH